MSGADDLFSTDAPPPVHDRLHRAAVLIAIAAPLCLLGPACFTGVPGAVLALVAWQFADEELARAETGALPSDRAPRGRRLRGVAFALLVFSIGSFFLQIALFALGVYDALLALGMALVTGEVPA